jgi:hypothetical protein
MVPAHFRQTGMSMRRRCKKMLEAGREARRFARKAAAKPAATKVIEDKRTYDCVNSEFAFPSSSWVSGFLVLASWREGICNSL